MCSSSRSIGTLTRYSAFQVCIGCTWHLPPEFRSFFFFWSESHLSPSLFRNMKHSKFNSASSSPLISQKVGHCSEKWFSCWCHDDVKGFLRHSSVGRHCRWGKQIYFLSMKSLCSSGNKHRSSCLSLNFLLDAIPQTAAGTPHDSVSTRRREASFTF